MVASASKDGTVRLWDVMLCKTVMVLSGHTHCVTCVRWGGEGLLYTSSQDRTIKVWRTKDVSALSLPFLLPFSPSLLPFPACTYTLYLLITLSLSLSQGALCRTLQGHGHWVNTMALNTDYALRTGAFDPADRKLEHCGIEGMSCECHMTNYVIHPLL